MELQDIVEKATINFPTPLRLRNAKRLLRYISENLPGNVISYVEQYESWLYDKENKKSTMNKGTLKIPCSINNINKTDEKVAAIVPRLALDKYRLKLIMKNIQDNKYNTTKFVVISKKDTTKEEVNEVFKKAAAEPRWSKMMKVTEDSLVSTDVIGEPYGAIVDLGFTKVVDGDLLTVYSWYDNEAGYTAELVEHVRRVAGSL